MSVAMPMQLDPEMMEIVKVFFEESAEGLDAMESGLLSLAGCADREIINTIFRAAHSIKGGAGTFGFMEISEFTHAVETLLDRMRNGARPVTSDAVQVLLQAVDVIREMLGLAQSGEPIVSAGAASLSLRLAEILDSAPAAAAPADAPPTPAAPPPIVDAGPSCAVTAPATPSVRMDTPAAGSAPTGSDAAGCDGVGWRIRFTPHSSVFRTCNDPLPLFGELDALGKLRVYADTDRIPALESLDPTLCHLSWTLELEGSATREQLVEIFDWVDANSSVHFEVIDGAERRGGALLEVEPGAAAIPAAPPKAPGAAASISDADVPSPDPAPAPVAASPALTAAALAAAPAAAIAPTAAALAPTAAAIAAAPAAAAAVIPGAASSAPVSAGGRTGGESGSIRVATEKVDALINLVGELVITQSMLGRFSDTFSLGDLDVLRRGLSNLARNTRELQESVLKIRMLPISFSFNRFPRLVHELSRKLEKKVELKLNGESTELDKTVLEKIGDPLVHLVRNSLDHGLERPEVRRAAGKSETGVLELNAYHEGGSIIIEVKDDGAGLNRSKILAKARERGLIAPDANLSDEQIHNLIFMPGFSTADRVSDVSGRGVGMDVVRRNINDLGGHVQISSTPGQGSVIRIRLPLTLAILEGQMLRVGRETYVISLVSIIETVQPKQAHLHTVTGRSELFKHRDEYLPIIRLHEMFGIEPDSAAIADGLLVVAESDGRRVAILVDELLAQQQVVIKSLDTNFRAVPGLAGATIHGDGRVALILDVPSLIGQFQSQGRLAPELAA